MVGSPELVFKSKNLYFMVEDDEVEKAKKVKVEEAKVQSEVI